MIKMYGKKIYGKNRNRLNRLKKYKKFLYKN